MGKPITGMLCPVCGNKLTCDPPYTWGERWIGLIWWSSCEPCERFFYILSDEDAYPITVIDAEFGMYPGDDGYSFDPDVNGASDDPDYEYHMAMMASRPKCDMCGVRSPVPVKGAKRCQKCLDRFGMVQPGQAIVTYRYIGDRLTDEDRKGMLCTAVRFNGKCITGKTATMLVEDMQGRKHVVLRRLLRKVQSC